MCGVFVCVVCVYVCVPVLAWVRTSVRVWVLCVRVWCVVCGLCVWCAYMLFVLCVLRVYMLVCVGVCVVVYVCVRVCVWVRVPCEVRTATVHPKDRPSAKLHNHQELKDLGVFLPPSTKYLYRNLVFFPC